MKITTIHRSDRYTVTSYGNGLAYGVVRDANGLVNDNTMFFQGDDAQQFYKELQRLTSPSEHARVILSWDDALDVLWEDYYAETQEVLCG